MFADDTYLTISVKNYFELQNSTNHDLENITQWPLVTKLSLNTIKTEFLIIGSDYNLANLGYSPAIRLGENESILLNLLVFIWINVYHGPLVLTT